MQTVMYLSVFHRIPIIKITHNVLRVLVTVDNCLDVSLIRIDDPPVGEEYIMGGVCAGNPLYLDYLNKNKSAKRKIKTHVEIRASITYPVICKRDNELDIITSSNLNNVVKSTKSLWTIVEFPFRTIPNLVIR
jgi:hypothetical protein